MYNPFCKNISNTFCESAVGASVGIILSQFNVAAFAYTIFITGLAYDFLNRKNSKNSFLYVMLVIVGYFVGATWIK